VRDHHRIPLTRLVDGTRAGQEWIGAPNQMEHPLALVEAYESGYRHANPATAVARYPAQAHRIGFAVRQMDEAKRIWACPAEGRKPSLGDGPWDDLGRVESHFRGRAVRPPAACQNK
jgi:hypothetical protein